MSKTQNQLLLEQLEENANTLELFFDGQPSASDLDECDEFLRNLHSFYATVSQWAGEAERLFNISVKHVVENTDDETYKRIKNSSTLTIAYVAACFPRPYQVWQRFESFKKQLELASNDYRTLLSSYRMQVDVGLRTQSQRARSDNNFPSEER